MAVILCKREYRLLAVCLSSRTSVLVRNEPGAMLDGRNFLFDGTRGWKSHAMKLSKRGIKSLANAGIKEHSKLWLAYVAISIVLPNVF